MNTNKQINAMVVLLFALLIVIGAYTIWDPFRSADADEAQLEKSADFGAQLFERNCRVCHGDVGEGPPASGRLDAALPLDTEELQGYVDGVINPSDKLAQYNHIRNTIMCGRIGTQMPTWGAVNGGTLNEEQVRQLSILINEGRWDLAEEHADATDALTTLNAKVDDADGSFTSDETDLNVSNAGPFNLGQYVRIEEERLRILPRQVLVERGVDGTTAAEHGRGTQLLVDGEPVRRNQSPTLRDGQIVMLGGGVESLAENLTAEDTALPVGDNSGFDVGDVIQLEDEHVRVTGFAAGLPSTGVFVAQEFRREPTKILVTGAGEIQEGDLIRIDTEPMEVKGLDEAGTGVALDQDVPANSNVVSVEDARFLRRNYQFRVGDEWMQVIGPVDTGQTVDATIGKAESTLAVSGTLGIEEGDIVRIDGELIKVVEIVKPTEVTFDRAQNNSTAAAHPAGTSLLKPAAEDAEDQTPTDIGQTTIEDLDASTTTVAVSSQARINLGDSYLLDNETVKVTAVLPAQLRIERGQQDTEVEPHGRRSSLFVANFLNVTRGINGTSAADHGEGDEIILNQLEVERAVGVKPLEHAKNAEIFQGNHLVVSRGQKATEAADHANGQLVRNFPTAPEGAPTTGVGISICGQNPVEAPPTPGGPTPTPNANATNVAVTLEEFEVVPDPTSGAAGAYSFAVTNGGAAIHNFRVIKTDLAPDQLPISGSQVDEAALDVVARSDGNVAIGTNQAVAVELEAGSYVLICDVPGHYNQGMHAAFTVQ